ALLVPENRLRLLIDRRQQEKSSNTPRLSRLEMQTGCHFLCLLQGNSVAICHGTSASVSEQTKTSMSTCFATPPVGGYSGFTADVQESTRTARRSSRSAGGASRYPWLLLRSSGGRARNRASTAPTFPRRESPHLLRRCARTSDCRSSWCPRRPRGRPRSALWRASSPPDIRKCECLSSAARGISAG